MTSHRKKTKSLLPFSGPNGGKDGKPVYRRSGTHATQEDEGGKDRSTLVLSIDRIGGEVVWTGRVS